MEALRLAIHVELPAFGTRGLIHRCLGLALTLLILFCDVINCNPQGYKIQNKCYILGTKQICDRNATFDDFILAPNLNLLTLVCNGCQISVLKREDLEKYGHLQNLSIVHSNLDAIQNGTFFNMSELSTVDLSSNNLHEFEEDLFFGLFELRTLTVSDNKLAHLNSDQFRDLNQLELLNLDHNSLTELDEKLFEKLDSLKILNLNHNLLSTLPPLMAMPATLEHLNLNHNLIQILPPKLFEKSSKLSRLDLSNNLLVKLNSDEFNGLINLVELNLAENRLEQIEDNSFSSLLNCKILNLHQNSLTSLGDYQFVGLSKLVELNLNRNQLKRINLNTFQTTPNLDLLNLAENQLNELQPGVFNNLYNLKMLNISFLPLKQFPRSALYVLHRLETLAMDTSPNPNFEILKKDLAELKFLILNNNGLNCDQLIDVFNIFKSVNISNITPQENHENIHGVSCSKIITTTKIYKNNTDLFSTSSITPITSTTPPNFNDIANDLSEIKVYTKGNMILQVFILIIALIVLIAMVYLLFLKTRNFRSAPREVDNSIFIEDDANIELINS